MRKPAAQCAGDSLSINQRYASYVELHCNLDTLLWNNQAVLHATTVLGVGSIGFVLEKEVSFGSYDVNDTLASVFAIMGILYGLASFTLARMGRWHRTVEEELKKLEVMGYFQERLRDRGRLNSAQWWTCAAYRVFSGASLLWALALLFME